MIMPCLWQHLKPLLKRFPARGRQVDTMIPEAFEQARDYAGLITVVGFLVAFVLSKLVDTHMMCINKP